ncbi:esterase FE4-like [Leptopilina heterotoma]|uniref:esterase FE4-like n=1 Tax=Leptopilina heterotoma TaxID=63436 RepID=UPI001CA7BD5F|nr:esterase FE4-like [Leptopilina heterotoma]
MQPTVTISQGKLNGTLQHSRYGRIYSAFLGIPFAEPPINNLRFSNPRPGKNWNGIRQANRFGNICPQYNGLKILGSEDCLFLNVFTPVVNFTSSSKQYPVMVWLHGGVFYFGSGSFYGAQNLLDRDIVLVTINYRLGIFGFLTTGDKASPGNYGLKDQLLALKWIQSEIHNFGGDPKQVTLFGESAGAASITLHAISEQSKDLFQKYILQSGNLLSPWAYRDNKAQKLHLRGIAGLLFCPYLFSKNLVKCMRRRSMRSIMLINSPFRFIAWTPTNEPNIEGAFLTENPAFLVDRIRDMPFIAGINRNEGLIVTSFLQRFKFLTTIVKLFSRLIVSFITNFLLSKNENLTEAVNKFYFNWKVIIGNNKLFMTNATRFLSDAFFFYPQVKMLETLAPRMKNSAYFYNFAYRGKFSFTNVTTGSNENIGVSHTDELNYLFPASRVDYKLKSGNYTEKDDFIVDAMIDLWTSFATTGKPVSKNLETPDLWKPFDSKRSNHLMIGDFNNNTKNSIILADSFYSERMNFWKKNAPN